MSEAKCRDEKTALSKWPTFVQIVVVPHVRWGMTRRFLRACESERSAQSRALLCFLLTDRIALRFWFPNTPGSFGFRRWRTRFSISRWRSRRGRFCEWGLDLRINGCPGLICGFRLRFGGVTGGVSPDSAWTMLPGSCAGGAVSAFLRVRVFLIGGGGAASPFGTCISDTGSVPPDGCVVFTADAADISEGVSRGGSGGTGAISSPPCKSRHTCSRLLAV